MHYKNILHLLIAFLFVSISFSSDKYCNKTIQKPLSAETHSFGIFDVNRITSHFSNDCMIASQLALGSSGMLFDNISINYNTGLWIADSSNGNLRIAAAEYGTEYIPGAYGTEYDQSLHGIITFNEGNMGLDFLGDQLYWYVCNDGLQNNHVVFHTDPLNIELQNTIWGYADQHENMKLQNVMFVKSIITNKGNSNLENAYIGIWSDPDLGYAGDDFVGCDTTLNLAYCYNDGEDNIFGANPPTMGIVLLRGPVQNTLGKFKNDNQYLPMTAFVKYS